MLSFKTIGDRDKFLDKFRTCIRARPYPEQKIPTELNHFLILKKMRNLI